MKKLIVILLFTLLASCKEAKVPMQSQLMHATLWYQNSAEFKALSYQAFNVAKLKIDSYKRKVRKLAIVVDVDETLLDNSHYQAEMIRMNIPFSVKSFQNWVVQKAAKPLPGAVDFINYAVSKGYEIFYVSNRSHENELNATYENLKRVGFPVEKDNMFFKTETSSKKDRRHGIIDSGYKIALLIGDAMGDFNANYDKKSSVEQNHQVELDKELFGGKYIVLPNPMYGKWESALYNYNYKLTEEEKYNERKKTLK